MIPTLKFLWILKSTSLFHLPCCPSLSVVNTLFQDVKLIVFCFVVLRVEPGPFPPSNTMHPFYFCFEMVLMNCLGSGSALPQPRRALHLQACAEYCSYRCVPCCFCAAVSTSFCVPVCTGLQTAASCEDVRLGLFCVTVTEWHQCYGK